MKLDLRLGWIVLLIFALLGLSASIAEAQTVCRPVPISGLGSTPYFVLVDGTHRSNHQSERTAINAAGDSLLFRPDADVRVSSDLFMRERCITLPEVVVDSTPPAGATNASLMGYASPDMLNPTSNGLVVTWDYAGDADSFRVRGGLNAGGDEWEAVVASDKREHRRELFYTVETSIWSCITPERGGIPAVESACDGFLWPPMVQL